MEMYPLQPGHCTPTSTLYVWSMCVTPTIASFDGLSDRAHPFVGSTKKTNFVSDFLFNGNGKMKKGSLRSKERSFEAFLPSVPCLGVLQPDPATPRQPLIKSRRGQQLCLAMPRRGNPRLCMERRSSTPEASRAHA
ncbi:hypothetical protein PIB30_077234 [Stylosanthes scabra]|uniref:Uncharacterized protein n=1 Tax=Stylosanthes scabra TaxID=79078 RepID=A0ABU6YPK1_9FABA|nr:hypothetical protein [Stylosanthes scabra]